MRKYSRDDVVPQLECQRKILAAVAKGWVSVVPLLRGVGQALFDQSGGTEKPSVTKSPSANLEDGEIFDVVEEDGDSVEV